MQFISTQSELKHYIYLDNNIFRLLKREKNVWDTFFDIFNKQYPEVFHDFEFLFTWSQLLEDLNLGTILKNIEKSNLWIWKKKKEINNLFNSMECHEALDCIFKTIYQIMLQLPELQKEKLIAKIEGSIKYSHPAAIKLIEETLIYPKTIIKNTEYQKELAFELAWAFITSFEFITSTQEWSHHEKYLQSLIALWHQFHQEGKEYNFYRLVQIRYYSYTTYSPLVTNADKASMLLIERLKHSSDLCDGELIHYSSIGTFSPKLNKYIPVIGITMDKETDIQNRMAIQNQTLKDLQRDVKEWNIKRVTGIIYCVKYDKSTKTITDVKQIIIPK